MKIVAFGGSIRSNGKSEKTVLDLAAQSTDVASLIENAKIALENNKLSNSEITAAAALMGAKQMGAEILYFPLRKLFKFRESSVVDFDPKKLKLDSDIPYIDTLSMNKETLSALFDAINSADGVILSTPVYFGDRSSVANKLLQLTAQKNMLKNKSFGVVSVGAKRNGGQETTSIFSLYEAIAQGAFAVGNGPKTSQYGGTVVAGDAGKVVEDEWGLETCYATGKRVAHTAQIYKTGLTSLPLSRTIRKEENSNNKNDVFKLKILMTMDFRDGRALDIIQNLTNKLATEYNNSIDIDIIELVESDIYRCIACNICPIPEKMDQNPSKTEKYACIIENKSDKLNVIREQLLDANAILICSLNDIEKGHDTIISRYQAFVERTRFIRRNNFELTNVPIGSLFINNIEADNNAILDLKTMVSYIRHNSIILKPIKVVTHQGKILINGEDQLRNFIENAMTIDQGRKMTKPIEVNYVAGGDGGYKDDRLDKLSNQRV